MGLGFPPTQRARTARSGMSPSSAGAGINVILGVIAVFSVAAAPDLATGIFVAGLPGFFIALLAALRGSSGWGGEPRSWAWAATANVGLGLWMVIGSFFTTGTFALLALVIGVLVMLVAAWGAWTAFRAAI